MLTAPALILGAAVALQLIALRRMGTRRPVGDETGYAPDLKGQDPYAPVIWLRPPLLAWLGVVCGRKSGPVEDRLRAVMATASVLTVALVAAAGWMLGGPTVALLGSALVLLQPERIILGCHIWPDNLLALTIGGINLLLVLPASAGDWVFWALGVLCAVGSLIRIDFLVTAPFAVVGLWMTGTTLDLLDGFAIVAPSVAAVALLSVRNHRRYGIPWPDTTWLFNLVMTESEMHRRGSAGFELDPLIRETVSTWDHLAPRQQSQRGLTALKAVLLSPAKLVPGVARRLLTLAGPDTFVRQVLLPRERAYPELSDGYRRTLGAALSLGFPMLLTVTLFTCWIGRVALGAYVWPSLGLVATSVLLHARTRYRLAVLPTVGLLAAVGVISAAEVLEAEPLRALLLLGAVPFLWGLMRIECSTERLPSVAGEQDNAELAAIDKEVSPS